MEGKGWADLDTRQWWFGVLVVAGPALVAAVSTGRDNVAIISVGVLVWAFGEWVQHPYQQFRKDGLIGNTYKRRWNVFGVILNILGIALVILGICRIYKINGSVI